MSLRTNATPRLQLSWHGRSSVGCARTNNEDSFHAEALEGPAPPDPADGVLEGRGGLGRPGALLAVADGMGGAKAGEIASGMAVGILGSEIRSRVRAGALLNATPDEMVRALVEAVELANERIRVEGTRDASREGMGTTLTVVWAVDDAALIAHVGDSRAYLFRKGNLQQITRDQSLVEKLLEDKIITPEEADNMAARNIILQALGSEEDLEVAEERSTLQPGDLLLLCTDGLCGVVNNRGLEEALRLGGSLAEMCERLVALAEERGGPDNITVILGRVEPEHQARS
jgi:protein phosphatase